MRCAILQPAYIPWRGFFHQIHSVDVFVHYDDVQYENRGWQNRNRIKTANGPAWLSIPVERKGHQQSGLTIQEARIVPGDAWHEKHWRSLEHAYRKAPYWSTYEPLLAPHFATPRERLVDVTVPLVEELSRALGIDHVRFVRASELAVEGTKTDRLLAVLTSLGADHYLSGPAAQAYLDEEQLGAAGISVEYQRYGYAEYEQLHPPYEPAVSVIDLLLMAGPDAGRHIWG